MGQDRGLRDLAWVTAAVVLLAVLPLTAQSGETFSATASVKSAAGASASVPVTIRIDTFVSDADREKMLAVVGAGDHAATRKALAAMKDIGYIEVGTRRTPVKFAYPRPSGSGRVVTVVTAAPIAFIGGAAPNAPSREGYDLALAILVVDEKGSGEGELVPAAKVKRAEAGAIVTDQYSSETVKLVGVARAK
jgi:hypothetical protein